MYCYNCGKEIAETVKFCPYCGAEQKQPQQSPQWQQPQQPVQQPQQQEPQPQPIQQQPAQWQNPQQQDTQWQAPQQPTQWQNPPAANNSGKNNFWQSRLPIILAAVALVVVVLLAVRAFHNRTDAQNELKAIATTEPAATEAAPTEKVTYTEPPAPTETEALTDGWHTINGKRYYIQDGEKYVDLQEIDDALYYFYEDGALAENEYVEYYGSSFHAGRDGKIDEITFGEIGGTWSDEDYHFGNNGRSSILELSLKMANCDSFQLYLEANGWHGAKVNGTWKIYIRCNGRWEYVQDIKYTEPSGYFDIKLNGYKDFDAITAYPTVQGNASYSAIFYLQNVHCIL